MSDIKKIINIQVYGDKAQVTMTNNSITSPINRTELKQLIDHAIKAEYAMKQAEDAKRPLRLVSSC